MDTKIARVKRAIKDKMHKNSIHQNPIGIIFIEFTWIILPF